MHPIIMGSRQGQGMPAIKMSDEDVKAVATSVLRHRVVTNFSAEAEGIKPERIVHDLLASVPTE